MRFNRRGFTLIELIVVMIIIGILASIAAPMMTGIKNKAIISEAITTLGSIRTAVRNYYVEFQKYPRQTVTDGIVFDPVLLASLGFKADDLQGRYWHKEAYWLQTVSPPYYVAAIVYPPNSGSNSAEVEALAPGAHRISEVDMDLVSGHVYQTEFPESGLPSS